MDWEVKIVQSKKPMDINPLSHILADIILQNVRRELDAANASQEPDG
ncbi:hypothetical protein [Longimicrobium terrae]|uniref:Uncharacterized protein n=1 Tax=Longimicrobium terrae TaxID=1639882 RepID=A0A841GN36_9BACT|nr:hypothetical protein [Longimicrobium terrae]MBB4635653.1 hypothetical protein [Longimicrobium terrae]MBB6070047.1 hypothetical protein [Longimicrobium terrae]NNC32952.1 hypothetical protein [Longimicrobium terrae]